MREPQRQARKYIIKNIADFANHIAECNMSLTNIDALEFYQPTSKDIYFNNNIDKSILSQDADVIS